MSTATPHLVIVDITHSLLFPNLPTLDNLKNLEWLQSKGFIYCVETVASWKKQFWF